MIGKSETIALGTRFERLPTTGACQPSDLEHVAEIGIDIEREVEGRGLRRETFY